MALLRGNSYVAGDLVVEGALQVRRLVLESNGFPYLYNGLISSKTKHLIQFMDDQGGISFAPVQIQDAEITASELENHLNEEHKSDTSDVEYKHLILETYSDQIHVINRGIKLKKPYTWEFDVPSKEEEKKES